ncbi:hypothetical protein [Sediminibacterium ginsengisoli]|uniref:Uncharacterized protein n=1 Tax=Sediminibacterium ginsengisoli TaxID=413434 RepID=A0A1T4RMS3_9BACT|nr:hypothetical protein [Sediminibacterium ginsengisoli]SKA17305.1 hypothetical protein SAMN04488132_11384 [Sediminibacterium ginsengisoli]
MKNNLPLYLWLLCALSCKPSREKTTAHIRERKLNQQGRLQIEYVYSVSGKEYAGTVELPAGTVVPQDTLSLFYSVNEPEKSEWIMP